MALASVSTLRDDFEDALVASAWNAVAAGSATVQETAGQARVTLPSSTAGTHTARYTSRVTYDLTGASFFVNIGTMVSTAVAATAFFQLYLTSTNTLQWIQLSGTLFARTIVNGVSTDRYSAAWSGTTYRYLRIRESAGSIVWESSTNGTSWTSRATLASPFAVTDLFIDFGATCGNVASPGSFRLDDVNLLLPALTTTWNWQQAKWELTQRTRTITTAIDQVGTAMGYVVTADGVDAAGAPSGNIRYWSGPMDAGRILTEQTTQAAAQAMAVYLPLDGRIDLPEMIEARCFRCYNRSVDALAYTVREEYPRRLSQADDIEAESIRAIHIGVIDLDAQHRITAGAGAVLFDDLGIDIIATAIKTPATAIQWVKADRTLLGEVYLQDAVSGDRQMAMISKLGAAASTLRLEAESTLSNCYVFLNNTGVTQIADISAVTIRLLGSVGVNSYVPNTALTRFGVKGIGTTNATFGIEATNSGGLVNFQALDDGTIRTRTGSRWDLRGFTAGGGTITGHVDALVDGTLRRLAVI